MTIRELMHWNRPFNLPVNQRDRRGQSLFSLQDDMNHLLQSFFSDNGYSQWDEGFSANMPAIDLIENERDFKVKAEVAGYNPDDIDVSVTDGFLTLSGERQDEDEEKDENYLRRETSYGSFQRTIALPETANCEKAEASFKNGVLNIEIPKKAEAVQKPKKLSIKKTA
jgi:HSP20 family protein